MSSEHVTSDVLTESNSKLDANKKSNRKVNINELLNRVRDKQKKEKRESLIFISLISFLVILTGIIVSF